MAYGKLYQIIFKNRIQTDIYRTEIWQKDYAGSSSELTGSEAPFIASYQDAAILEPIKSVGFTISFFNNSALGINDFYSDDDEEFRVDHYFQSFEDGSGTEKLLFSGYLVQDGSSEPITDRNHILTLKATDNLALLKNVKWNEINDVFFGTFPLSYYFRNCLKQTGLYSADTTIDQSLPLRLYGNLFENTTDDRADDDLSDPYAETVLNSGIFQSSDNTWDDCYTVLTKILTDINACLCQADGCWNVIRTPEYSPFVDGQIPGTQYVYNGSGTDITAITLTPLVNIERTGGDCYPVEEDQTKAIQRPFKSVLNTFNYSQPGSFIENNSLILPAGATPFATNTVADLRYDDYALATYFPNWIQTHGDSSYLEIVTDTSSNPENEVDRYIVTPGVSSQESGVQFNAIPITRLDLPYFTLSFKMLTADSNTLRFFVRIELIVADGTFYQLNAPVGGGAPYPIWAGPFSTNTWDTGDGIYYEIAAGDPKTDWTTWDLLAITGNDNTKFLPVPSDGMLLIEVRGTNSSTGNRQDTVWKDIKLDVQQYINQSTQVIGQTHFDLGTSTIKATEEDELLIDDSPRRTIAGTLFTSELTNFDFTDVSTGGVTNIGNIYFTPTRTWHRDGIVEAFRLGHIIAQERLLQRFVSRLIVEGSFRNIRYDTDKFISILSLFRFGTALEGDFLSTGIEINYMNCSFRSKLVETFNDASSLDDTYQFNYLYKTD